jgi:hypothetical protein
MSQVTIITFDPRLILPYDPIAFHDLMGNEHYYNAMGFLASTIRDLHSDASIYQGDDISDSVEQYFSEYRDMQTQDFYNQHTDEMIRKATVMHHLMPPGIFERLDFWEQHPRAIYFSGILHANDYR